MVGYIKVVFWWLIPLFLIFNSVDNQKQFEFNEIKHSISIKHPGEEGTVEVVLIEVQNKNGLPVEYYMDVESVICLEEVCKVIPVTVFWNNIGEYKKYKLEEGATLEKYEANLFEPNDYKKIHTILQNKNSPLFDFILNPELVFDVSSEIILSIFYKLYFFYSKKYYNIYIKKN